MPVREDEVAAAAVVAAQPVASPRRWSWAAHGAVAAFAVFTYLWRLGTADWIADEVVYSQAGRAYLRGDFALNPEHPVLAKYLVGLGELVVGAPFGTRLASALSGLGITLLLYLLARCVAGERWGLVAALGWLLLPHALPAEPDRFGVPLLDRFALLDPVATALALLALVLGWRWAHAPALRLAALTGVSIGLATGAKLSAVLVAPVVAIAVCLCARDARRAAGQLAVAAASAVTAFAVLYVPVGSGALALATSPVTEQLDHAATGHRILLAGRVYESAPWWSHLYFAWRDDGVVVTAVVVVLVASALLWSAERGLVAYLAAAAVVPFAVLSLSPVALPYYRFLWQPQLVLLGVLGLRALLRRGAPSRAVAALAALAVLVVGAQHLVQLVRLAPGAYGGAACAIEAVGAAEGRAVVRGYPAVLGTYLPALQSAPDFGAAPVDVVLLDPRVTSRTPAPEVVSELAARRFVAYGGQGVELHLAPQVVARTGAPAALRDCGLAPLG